MTSHDGSLSCRQQLVGDVEVAGVGEDRQQVAAWPGSRCRGGCPALRISSTSRSATAGRSSSGTRSKASARTWLACVSGVSRPSASEVLGPPRVADVLGELGVPGGVVGPARAPRRSGPSAGRCARRTPSRRRPCPRRRRRRSRRRPRPGTSHSPQWKPVSQRYRSCGAGSGRPRGTVGVPLVPGHPLDAVQPGHHRRPQLVEELHVAVGAVQLPRHDDGRVAPAGRAVQEGDRALPALAAGAGAHVGDRCRRATGPRRRRAATWWRSRRRRRGTRRSARTAASRRSTPARSRCGQSVGTSQALPRRLQTAASWKRSSRSSLQENQPVRRMSVCTTTPRTSSAVRSSGWPSMRTYWKPCVVRRGSNTSPGTPAETTWSTWPAGSGSGRNGTAGRRWSVVTSPSGPSHSPWVSVIVGAGRPEVGQPDPAVDVLARGRRPAGRRRAG